MGDIQTILAGSFFFQMTVCAGFIAVVLSSLNQDLKNISFDIVINLFCLLLEIQLNYMSCNYANSVTEHSFNVGDIIYDSFWYRLPIKQQKAIQFTIQRAQEPFYFKGYKIFICSMETFLKVHFYFQLFFFK